MQRVYDPTDLGLICLVKKRKIHFRILSDLRIQSWIFVKKRSAFFALGLPRISLPEDLATNELATKRSFLATSNLIRQQIKERGLIYICTGSPSSKYLVYATACVYGELYGKIIVRKKNCVNNYLI